VADLDTSKLPAGTEIEFTLNWLDKDRWQEEDFAIQITRASS
jgi:hypothetical protein